MGALALLKTIALAVLEGLGLYRQAHDQSIGAELQRGKDSADELTRLTHGLDAGNDPHIDDPARVQLDQANRDNQRP